MINTAISKARLHLKRTFDRINNEEVKRNVLQAIPFWVASIITGLIAVVYTKLFLLAENLTALIYKQHEWYLFILMPGCFLLAWWLVKYFSPFSRGSGIPQVMAAIEITSPRSDSKVNKLLSIKVIL